MGYNRQPEEVAEEGGVIGHGRLIAGAFGRLVEGAEEVEVEERPG
jgi:hypothetical protein